jgi:putative MATE family efflux protein
MGSEILIDPSEDRINIAKKVSKLALPIIFSNLLYAVETSVSLILVSGISSTAVAGVGYSNSMLWFVYSLMALSYTGTSVLIAQRVGAGKDPSPAFLWGLISAFLIALPLTFFGADITTTLMVQFGASKEVAEVSYQYLEPIFLFITVGFIIDVFYGAYNGYGDTKTPFKIDLLISLTDIIFSYLLIYGKFGLPRLEVAGAGWGMVIAEILGLLAYLYLYIAYRRPFPVRLDLGRDVLLKMLRIGSPTALERAITSLSFNIFVGMVASFGTHIPLMINISSFWLFRIIPSYILLKFFPSPIVPWVFMSVETTLRALIFYLAYRRIISKLTSPTIKKLPAS